MIWLTTDLVSNSANRTSVLDDIDENALLTDSKFTLTHHDILFDAHPYESCDSSGQSSYPNNTYFGASDGPIWHSLISNNASGSIASYYPGTLLTSYTSTTGGGFDSSQSIGKYKVRSSNGDRVKISIENDKIKVQTDDQIGYAVPAQCNVDIVLAVPTNGAACNENNNDNVSTTTGSPYFYSGGAAFPTAAKNTPIYQMGQALKIFVKENFYHIRGVNMSLIPYSGKVSVSPDRATAWTVAFPSFVDEKKDGSGNPIFASVITGACLYGTSGVKDALLKQSAKTKALVAEDKLPTTDTSYYWGGVLTACPIMFRAGLQQTEIKYGGNSYFRGFLANFSSSGTALAADNTNPSKGASYKYIRMNLNPCYMGYANMLSMKCKKNCTHFLPNPYYMIEPTADLVKIYEMCNALYPIYDVHNVSNFIFIPLEWAMNFFRPFSATDTGWTREPGIGYTSGTSATLSRPYKKGNKKALILLVNKPDCFEPGEMTYLGFNNDRSEVPVGECDKIDFSINYATNTIRKFLDNSTYDGTISGPKKILQYATVSGSVSRNSTSGYYECPNTGKGRLLFPKKGTLIVTVRRSSNSSSSSNGTWELCYSGDKTLYSICSSGYDQIVVVGDNIALSSSDDGNNWSKINTDYVVRDLLYNGSNFISVSSGGVVYSSTDGISWKQIGSIDLTSENYYGYTILKSINGIAYGGGIYIASAHRSSAGYLIKSSNGINWSEATEYFPTFTEYYGDFHLKGITYTNGNFYVPWEDNEHPGENGHYGVCISSNGSSWSNGSFNFSVSDSRRTSITTASGKKYKIDGKNIYIYKSAIKGSVTFSNVSSNRTSKNEISSKLSFSFNSNEILDNKIDGNYYVDFDMSNIRLISAEITNIPEETLTPASVTYNDPEIITSDQSSTNLSWGARSITCPNASIDFWNQDVSNSSNLSYEITPTKAGTTTLKLYTPKYADIQLAIDYGQPLNEMRSNGWRSMCYAHGALFASCADGGFFARSYDGVNWSKHAVAGGNWITICYNPKLQRFFAIGTSRCNMWRSTDKKLTAWEDYKIVLPFYINYEETSGGKQFAVFGAMASNDDGKMLICQGNNNLFAYSTDSEGKMWSTSNSNDWTYNVCYSSYYNKFFYKNKGDNNRATPLWSSSTGTTSSWSSEVSYLSAVGSHDGPIATGGTHFVTLDDEGKLVDYDFATKKIIYDGAAGALGANYWAAIEYNPLTQYYVMLHWNGTTKIYQNSSITAPSINAHGITYAGANNNIAISGSTVNIPAARLTKESNRYSLTITAVGSNPSTASLNAAYQPCLKIKNTTSLLVFARNNASGTRLVNLYTSAGSYDSAMGTYYRDIEAYGTAKYAAYGINKTETVDDLIDFTTKPTESLNGSILKSTFSGSKDCGLYLVSSQNSARISTSFRGDIDLVVAPSFRKDNGGTITQKYGNDTASKSITAKAIISVKKDDLQYDGNSKRWYMDFDVKDIILLYAKLKNSEPKKAYPTALEHSSTIDFSVNNSGKPKYNSNLVMYADGNYNEGVPSATTFSNNIGFWCTTEGNNNFYDKQPYSRNDFFMLWEDINSTASWCGVWYGNGTNSWHSNYLYAYIPGSNKLFSDYKQNWPAAGFSAENGRMAFIWAGFTQPINAALYNYKFNTTVGSNTDSYVSPTNDFNTSVIKQVTTDACSKLKELGTRIYVVMFRKQSGYNYLKRNGKSAYSSGSGTYDYSYISKCATDSGGKAYDVGNNTATLKAKLDEIAADIKTWANYEEAKNVE